MPSLYIDSDRLCKKSRYVVDAADRDSVPISRAELHELLNKPSLSGIPLLVLGNKIDKSEALSKQVLMDQLYVFTRPSNFFHTSNSICTF